MRRGGAQRLGEVASGRPAAAAIDDQAVVADAHLEAERAGVSDCYRGRDRPADVEQHGRALGVDAMETGMRCARRRLGLAVAQFQGPLDRHRIALAGTVEQREAAVAEQIGPQHRRHAVDGALQQFGEGVAAVGEHGTHLDQRGERVVMAFGLACAVAAVGIDPLRQLIQ